VHLEGRVRVHVRSRGRAFPPDIPVAKVTKITKKTGELEPTISLAPIVNLDDLTYVKVLRWPETKGN
jgi:cell shape-determining protein MreC